MGDLRFLFKLTFNAQGYTTNFGHELNDTYIYIYIYIYIQSSGYGKGVWISNRASLIPVHLQLNLVHPLNIQALNAMDVANLSRKHYKIIDAYKWCNSH